MTASAVSAIEVLSPLGYGEVRFGDELAQVEEKLGQAAFPKSREWGCDFVSFKKYPRIRFMVEEGVVTRADAETGVKNSAGVTVGMSFRRVKSRHPTIEVAPHKYDDRGHYLVLPAEDGRAALLFEESSGQITAVRAGVRPSVEYVEGCL